MNKKTEKAKKPTKDNPEAIKLFTTLAITEDYKREPEMNMPIPSDFNVKEAKDWVDHNKK